MVMKQCSNCGKLTGFKRNLGIGTIIMCFLTLGFWILAIPFYPTRCTNCGSTLPVNHQAGWALLFVASVLGCLVMFHHDGSPVPSPVIATTSGPSAKPQITAEEDHEIMQGMAISNGLLVKHEDPVVAGNTSINRIRVADLLAAYQRDEDSANRIYLGKRVIITGVMAGLLIPSPAEEAREADAIVSLNTCPDGYICPEEQSLSVVDVATRAGVFAYSKSGSIFGLDLDPTGFTEREVQGLAEFKLGGRLITLLCTFDGERRALIRQESRYGVPQRYGYSVLLTECALRDDLYENVNAQGIILSGVN